MSAAVSKNVVKVVFTCNPSSQEAEAVRSPNLGLDFSTQQVSAQHKLPIKSLSRKRAKYSIHPCNSTTGKMEAGTGIRSPRPALAA